MNELRTCSKCCLEKPYDQTQKRNSKASGFYGAKCWDCHLMAQNLKLQCYRGVSENRTKQRASNVKSITKRRKQDAHFLLKGRLAAETSRLIRNIIKGKSRDETIFSHFGAPREEVFCCIDEQLKIRGFQWAGYGKQWVLDHIVPLASAQDSNQLRQLCVLSNCQVLTPEENQRKGVADRQLIKSLVGSAKHDVT